MNNNKKTFFYLTNLSFLLVFLPLWSDTSAIFINENGQVAINSDDTQEIPTGVDLQINGTVQINGNLQLPVSANQPTTAQEGSVYINSTDNKMYFYIQGAWVAMGSGSGQPTEPEPTFRVKEYYITTGDFTGTTYDLSLDQDLANDYFVLVRGAMVGSTRSYPDNHYARLSAVPGGKGGLASSTGSSVITLSRHATDFEWEGVVTVVECLNNHETKGFRLLDAVSTDITGSTISGTSTSSTPWTDLSKVVLFGGFKGAGAEFKADATNYNQGVSLFTRIWPTGTDTINWDRKATNQTLLSATMTTLVVQFGSEWGVQRAYIGGSNGGGGVDSTGEYTTSNINEVVRENTWVWGTGTRLGSGIGICSESCTVTLGDGVSQNNSESTVAVGSEYNTHEYYFDVYVMTHPDLNVNYFFKSDGDKVTDYHVAMPEVLDSSARFAWVTTTCHGTGDYHPRDISWAHYTTDSEISIGRAMTQNFTAWLMGIDFSAIK